MNKERVALLAAVLLVIAVVVAAKARRPAGGTPAATEMRLPRLLDLGSTTCIPCRKMAPILEELKTELQGKVEVQFIDITKDAEASDRYGIKLIPTQIFFDAAGNEVMRHEGFLPKADVVAQLREMGVEVR